MSFLSASITSHTTASTPRPHILYVVDVVSNGAHEYQVTKRYSDFVALQTSLSSPFAIPPKRILTTTFIPSYWADDVLITERKQGLTDYLSALLKDPTLSQQPELLKFLAPSPEASPPAKFDLEDALPSTLSRKEAAEAGTVHASATFTAGAYYPDWSTSTIPPSSLDFSKFDVLFFAFVTPNSSSTLNWDSGAQSSLQSLVSAARNSGRGTKIVLSCGGWGGSYWFSNAMSSSGNRQTFVNALSSAVNTYGLDGIDIDWEYPNQPGAGNPYSSSDAANLLSFFQLLRSTLGSSKWISAAVTDLPWTGANGSPLTSVSAYAQQMTCVNIMNYDIWGASSNPGPNAPLSNACGNSSQPAYSAQAAFNQWTAAGFPANKLLLGLPLYGYVSQSSATTLHEIAMPPPGFVPSEHQARVRAGAACPIRKSGVPEVQKGEPKFLNGAHPRDRTPKDFNVQAGNGDLSGWFNQQIPFSTLVSLGALQKNSDGTYTANGGNGYTQAWDDCSDTPFIFNQSRSTVVTYDDTWSLGDKAAFVRQNGMMGTFTWSLDQDDGYALQNAIRNNLGK